MSVNSLAAMSASLTDLKAHKFDRYAPGDADVSFDIAYCGICHTVHLPRFFAPAPPPAPVPEAPTPVPLPPEADVDVALPSSPPQAAMASMKIVDWNERRRNVIAARSSGEVF